MPKHERSGLFPALLKYWRNLRGMSQLDLALAADVSSRHVSFLETGRSTPSDEMILRLSTTLDVPLRHVNAMLQAAGFEPAYPEGDLEQNLPDEIAQALQLMKQHHDPFPLIVVDRVYNVLDMNQGATNMFGTLASELQLDATNLNLARLTFDPRLARDVVVNFDEIGRSILWRMQREVLADPNFEPLRDVLNDILAMPTVSDDWREADLTVLSSPALTIHLRMGEQILKFITTVTSFQSPQSVLLDEMRIETWFPVDETTQHTCMHWE